MKKSKKITVLSVSLAAFLILNLVFSLLPYPMTRADVSGTHAYEPSDRAKQQLASLDEDVDLIYHVKGGIRRVSNDLYFYLKRLSDCSSHLHFEVADASKEGDNIPDQTVEVRSGKRSRFFSAFDLRYYQNSQIGLRLSYAEYLQGVQNLSQIKNPDTLKQMYMIYGPEYMKPCFAADQNLVSAVEFVLSDEVPTVSLYGKKTAALPMLLMQKLEQSGCGLQLLDSLNTVPKGTDALILNLGEDLTEEEAAALKTYLEQGGSLFLTTNYSSLNLKNLISVIGAYGLTCPKDANLLYDGEGGPQFTPIVSDHPTTDAVKNPLVVYCAHSIQLIETEGVVQTGLLRTSANGVNIFAGQGGNENPTRGSYLLGVAAEKGDTRIVWLGMPFDSLTDSMSAGANFDYCVSVISWMTGHDSARVSIPAPTIPTYLLSPSNMFRISWVFIAVILLPAGLVLIGFFRRKYRQMF